MAENRDQPKVPTHRAFTVIRREGQDDFWLNLGLVFPHKDGGGFNIMLQAFPLDGKIVCRKLEDDDKPAQDHPAPRRSEPLQRRENDGDQARSRPSRQR
jgi:hypothetical protein